MNKNDIMQIIHWVILAVLSWFLFTGRAHERFNDFNRRMMNIMKKRKKNGNQEIMMIIKNNIPLEIRKTIVLPDLFFCGVNIYEKNNFFLIGCVGVVGFFAWVLCSGFQCYRSR